MSSYVRRPTFANQLAATKNRINTLERQLRNESPQPNGHVVTWSYSGPISDFINDISHPGVHPRGGNLLQLRASLNVVGATPTVMSVRFNGTQFATMTIAPGNNSAETFTYQWCGRADKITFVITSAGTDAEDLSIVGEYDR